MSINERVKQIRQSTGLSQAKFSAIISISDSYIATIEVGKRMVNERIIKLICSEFNVNEHWLKSGEGEMFNQQPIYDKKLTKAANIFKNLDPDFQDYALQQIDALLKLQQQSIKKNRSDTVLK